MKKFRECPEDNEDFVCLYPAWNEDETASLDELASQQVSVQKIAKKLHRCDLEVFLRLVELGWIDPSKIDDLWGDVSLDDDASVMQPWTRREQRIMVKLFYRNVSMSKIGHKLGRDGLDVLLRLIDLGILAPQMIDLIWDDYFANLQRLGRATTRLEDMMATIKKANPRGVRGMWRWLS